MTPTAELHYYADRYNEYLRARFFQLSNSRKILLYSLYGNYADRAEAILQRIIASHNQMIMLP